MSVPAAQDQDWTRRTAPVEEAELRVTGQVGSPGATGTVYEVAGQPACMFKKYIEPSRHAARLGSLVAWRNSLSWWERNLLDEHCAWPLVTVTSGGETTGFLMRAAPDDFWADMAGEPHTLELQHLIHARSAREFGIDLPGPGERLNLVRDLAEILAFFDAHQVVYGDVNERNVFWTTRGFPRVFLIDCDNSRPADLPGAAAGVAMPRNPSWRDPDLPDGGYPDSASDRYALAVFCYRAFYDCYRDPGQPMPSLAGERSLILIPERAPRFPVLERCLARGVGARRSRPSAADWLSAIAATDVPGPDTAPAAGPGPTAPLTAGPPPTHTVAALKGAPATQPAPVTEWLAQHAMLATSAAVVLAAAALVVGLLAAHVLVR